jgi:hypothetical protein
MEVEDLMKALDNETNENIINLTSKKILNTKLNVLNNLNFDKLTKQNYLKKLEDYRYVDEINELKYGAYVRWINLNNVQINNCGIICDIKITDNGVVILCKNFMHRHYTFKMDECIIFQKLTSQEKIIIMALDHLEEGSDEDFEDESDEEEY